MSKTGDMMLIIKDISEIAADLMKCRFRQFGVLYREILTKTLTWVLIVLTAILFAIGGIGMIVLAVYRQLSLVLGPAGSAYILGGFLILLAIIIFLFARNTVKD